MFFLVRHGERGDQSNEEAELSKIERSYDVHLTEVGHVQALKTGKFIKSKIEELVKAGKVDPDCQIKLVSSPYYRTLQTARMIAEGLENKIQGNTIYVESAIEEWQHPECKFDEHHRPNRFFDSKHPAKLSELFPSHLDRKYQFNTLFDYSKPNLLISNFPETMESGEQRMFEYLTQLGNFFFHGKEDPRKTVFVMVSHGFHVDSFAKYYHDQPFAGKYCCTHFAEILKCEEKMPELNVEILGHYAY